MNQEPVQVIIDEPQLSFSFIRTVLRDIINECKTNNHTGTSIVDKVVFITSGQIFEYKPDRDLLEAKALYFELKRYHDVISFKDQIAAKSFIKYNVIDSVHLNYKVGEFGVPEEEYEKMQNMQKNVSEEGMAE